ncbi:hypothetical protein COCSUDRAFT_54501 [Coccomyxa subellipsoidea C-169]|uniref:Uncharacterized protein n=1 Tax=Coccomyxa subellipsoidea (strain C-169) TaxID=574566 RepID=I0YNF6_COCSC|nr:hypothetical protein COCSUDRAFT_54501 [Coccomyxa subellipsoidea C-169]EIE19925.1 hypothetical protein COCSUDRAFT_54501 [Coccomyxa subellipsoidea C-169]|eukprot:XP_005644469.1 hypothetical protein COCSUDRAFT_54501 [Coccomyxa subellipsoidea C-169]
MAVALAFQSPGPQKRREGRRSSLDNGLSPAELFKYGAARRPEGADKQIVHMKGCPLPAMAGNSHLLIVKDFRQHKRALQLASAFSETAKLAKRVRELENVDAELEAYRQVLQTAISFHRRRRALCRLASISEED